MVVRNIKVIDRIRFATDIRQAFRSFSSNIDCAVDNSNSKQCTGNILDTVALAKKRRRRNHSVSPWYNHEIALEKRSCRQAERKWRSKGKLEIDRQLYCYQRKVVNSLVYKAKWNYYVSLIEDCEMDSTQLFSVTNYLLDRKKSSPLLAHVNDQCLAHA